MWGNSLLKFYYTDKQKYQNIFNERIASENTYLFDFMINGNKAFFFFHKDIYRLVSEISFLDKQVDKLLAKLPFEAKSLYIRKSLIDEILYTNEIEGVILTRKEIDDLLNSVENKERNKNKIISLVNKYCLLLHEYFLDIKSCHDIRKLYDELVLDEFKSNDNDDCPDGVIFRQNGVNVLNEVTGKVLHEGVMPESAIIDFMTKILNF